MWYNTHIVPEKIKNVFILKKLLFSFVLLSAVLFGLFTFPTISHALETNMLKPMSTNVKNFKEVAVKKIIDFDGEEGYEVTIEDVVEESGLRGYSVMVDFEKGIYTTEELTKSEIMEEHQKDAVGTEIKPIDIDTEEKQIMESMVDGYGINSTKTTWFEVKAITRDPVFVDLNQNL